MNFKYVIFHRRISRKAFLTNSALLKKQIVMSHFSMQFTIRLIVKTFWTALAFVRFYLFVNYKNVSFDRRFPRKGFLTNIALMTVEVLMSLCSMQFKISLIVKTFGTALAFVRFILFVNY
jgi:hypothetical protein